MRARLLPAVLLALPFALAACGGGADELTGETIAPLTIDDAPTSTPSPSSAQVSEADRRFCAELREEDATAETFRPVPLNLVIDDFEDVVDDLEDVVDDVGLPPEGIAPAWGVFILYVERLEDAIDDLPDSALASDFDLDVTGAEREALAELEAWWTQNCA